MTNGEKLKEIFPNGLFLFKKDWLDEEYEEPTTKKNLEVEKIEKLKPCINYEDGCEEWAGCPCVHYKARK